MCSFQQKRRTSMYVYGKTCLMNSQVKAVTGLIDVKKAISSATFSVKQLIHIHMQTICYTYAYRNSYMLKERKNISFQTGSFVGEIITLQKFSIPSQELCRHLNTWSEKL